MGKMTHTDIPAEKDLFKIGEYITGLSEFIKECDTPMTIAIQGDWGTGKTSIMQMIKSNVEEGEGIPHVWFNTWQFSHFNMQDNLSITLIESIVKQLNSFVEKLEVDNAQCKNSTRESNTKYERTKAKTIDMLAKFNKNKSVEDSKKEINNKYEKVLGTLAKLNQNKRVIGGKIFEDIFTKFKFGQTAKVLNSILQINEEGLEGIEKLKKEFEEFIQIICKKVAKERVVIFIDDLDRLKPSRAVEILEVLKNFLDVPRCIFILAIDYKVVEKGINDKYEIGFQSEKDKNFFDKIIQLPFKMPVDHYDIDDYIKDKFTETSGTEYDKDDIKDLVEIIKFSVGSNPRSIKRLFNSFSLLLRIWKCKSNETISATEGKLLFAVLCIQQYFEDFYSYLVQYSSQLTKELLNKLEELSTVQAEIEVEQEYKLQKWNEREEHDELNNSIKVLLSKLKSEEEVKEIENFMKLFNALLPEDNGNDDSENDPSILMLKKILQHSSVTSNQTLKRTIDTTPNYKGQQLIRKIFNAMVPEERKLSIEDGSEFGKEEKEKRRSKPNDEFSKCNISLVRISQGSGQGMHIYPGIARGVPIYLAAGGKDGDAKFPSIVGCWVGSKRIPMFKDYSRGKVSDLLEDKEKFDEFMSYFKGEIKRVFEELDNMDR